LEAFERPAATRAARRRPPLFDLCVQG